VTHSSVRQRLGLAIARLGVALTALLMMCSGPTDTTRPNPDTLAPLVDGNVLSFDDSITSVLGAHIFLPGDTLAFQVMAQDNVALEWIGFRFSGAATLSDSILVPDSLRSKTVGVTVRVIPAQGASGLLTVTGFGRDTSGNLGEVVLAGSPASFVVPITTYVPQIGFDVDGRGFAMDGPDGSRRFYWITGSSSLGVFEDNARSTYIPLPGQGRDIDFTLNKDSLILTIPALHEYGIVDLLASYPTLTLVPDSVTTTQDQPWLLRIAANNHAVVYRRSTTDTTTGSYVDWNLTTGEQQLIPGALVHGSLDRTSDRNHIIVWEDTACCTGRAQVYTSATRTFAAPVTFPASPGAEVRLDAAGSFLLVGSNLLTFPSLDAIVPFHLPAVLGPMALSKDGRTIFASTAQGILRVRVSDGVGYDLVDIGGPPPRLFTTPDGGQLFMPFASFIRYADLPTLPPRSPGSTLAQVTSQSRFIAQLLVMYPLRSDAPPGSDARP